MKKIIPFLLVAMCFSFGFSAEVFAAEDMGLGDKASRQFGTKKMGNVLLGDNSGKNVLLRDDGNNILSERSKKSTSRVRISPVTCTHTVFVPERLVHVYDQDGKVELKREPAQELRIRVPCPKE